MFEPTDVRVGGCTPRLPDGLVSLPLEIAVRQEIEPEAVTVHWTTDGWNTQQAAPA